MVAQIMRVADVSRQTVFTYRDKVVAGGVAGLLQRGHGGGPVPTVRGAVAEELIERLEAGQFGRRGMRRLGSRNAPAKT
jgi:Winged helix-turn helix